MQISYTNLQGENVLILFGTINEKGLFKSEECPFCGEEHTHGKGLGHRLAHCSNKDIEKYEVKTTDGTVLKVEDGYIIAYAE